MWWTAGVGTVLLLLSFAARRIGMSDQPELRYLIVYPSGLFFAAVILGFFAMAVKDLVCLISAVPGAVHRLVRPEIALFELHKGQPKKYEPESVQRAAPLIH